MNLLLLSNSRSPDGGYLTHAGEAITEVAGGRKRAIFIPYAGVTISWDDYTKKVQGVFSPLGIEVTSAHRAEDPAALVAQAEIIVVGGGNTFNLLKCCRDAGLLPLIASRVKAGAPYIGWSAGSNLACPTICTTNDMPIIDPGGLGALGLVPFQINPHYTEAHPPGHRGETRLQRLREFCTLNPQVPVLGLPEGTGLRIHDDKRTLQGREPARWFLGTQAEQLIQPGHWTDA